MRKFLMAVAVVGIAILVATPSMALDFKFGAEYRIRFYDYSNINFDSKNTLFRGNPRGVQIRVRPRFDVSDDNGNITATIRFEYGDTTWGAGGGANGSSFGSNGNNNIIITPGNNRVGNNAGGSIGADGVALETKWAYIDFALPANIPLRVRAGIQPWYLPKGLVIDDDASGVRAYGNTGDLNYELFWYRAGKTATNAINSFSGNGANIPGADNTKDNSFDFYGAKVGYNFAKFLNASAWYMYGDNRMNCTTATLQAQGGSYNQANTQFCPGQDRTRPQHWFGVDLTGTVATVDWDLDFAYGSAKGGTTGSFTKSNGAVANVTFDNVNTSPVTVAGWAIDGGVHIPIGPVKLNLLGTYATGDSGKNDGKGAFPLGPGPSWSGAGGQYELIGEGGAFDVFSMTQHGPTGLWMLGATVEYVPVKALWTRIAYGYAGWTSKWANCAWAYDPNTGALKAGDYTCYGPVYIGKPSDNMIGKSSLGQEINLRADYTMWTGFKVQGMAGWMIPTKGDVAGKYILQLYYNF